MSFLPRTNPYFDWPEARVRDEIGRLNVPPKLLKAWSAGAKQRRTIQLKGLNQRLEEILLASAETAVAHR